MDVVGAKNISGAVRHIPECACDGISVADVPKVVPLSRRTLETR